MSRLTDGWTRADARFRLRDMLTALLMACGLSLCGLKAMTGVFSAGACLLWCLSGALTVWCAVMMKKKGALLLAGLFISQVILFFFQKGLFFALEQLFRAVILRVRGDEGVFGFYTPQIVCAFSYTVSMLITFFALQGATGSCAALSVGLLTAAALLSGGDRHTLVYAVPVMAGLMLMLCRDRKGVRWIAIPLCIALAVIAYILVPSNSGAVSPFDDAAEEIRETVEDYLLYTGEREHFSLEPEGYLPLSGRLGGKADPTDEPALLVEGQGTVYLRAMSYDKYDAWIWRDTLGTRRYLHISTNNRELRKQVFDSARPLAGAGMAERTLSVKLLKYAASTLYVPQRTRQLTTTGKHMVAYWNNAGEMFITRNLEPGDSYTVSYLPLDAGDASTQRMIEACAGAEDEHYAEVCRDYLTYPAAYDSVPRLVQIAREAAGNGVSPYEKAMNIAGYLAKHYSYSLDVAEPPADTDFCAYFLLTEKKGYCTYFATAMTLLCRMNGIPARYVTGYLARMPAGGGEATLRGWDAHAWTEIYLNGFGWLTVDGTPGEDGEDRTGDDPSGDSPDDQNDDTPPATPPPASPTPEPTPPPPAEPSPAASPSPSPAPDGQDGSGEDDRETDTEDDGDGEQEQEPSPSPAPGDQSMSTPTPAPSSEPDHTGEEDMDEDGEDDGPFDEEDREEDSEEENGGTGLWWLILLLILLTGGGIALRVICTEPHRLAKRKPEKSRAVWTGALTGALRVYRLSRNENETLRCFAIRADKTPDIHGKGVYAALEETGAAMYGSRPVGTEKTRRAYENLYVSMNLWQRLRLVCARILRKQP